MSMFLRLTLRKLNARHSPRRLLSLSTASHHHCRLLSLSTLSCSPLPPVTLHSGHPSIKPVQVARRVRPFRPSASTISGFRRFIAAKGFYVLLCFAPIFSISIITIRNNPTDYKLNSGRAYRSEHIK